MPAPLQWQPTREGYLQFLAESRLLFQTLEDIMAEAPHPDCAPLTLAWPPLLGNPWCQQAQDSRPITFRSF